jgi:hypothetical protein
VHLDSIVPVLASGVLSVVAPLSAQRPRADSLQRNTPAYDIAYAFEARSPRRTKPPSGCASPAPWRLDPHQLPAWYPRYAIYNFAANAAGARLLRRPLGARAEARQADVGGALQGAAAGRATIEFTLGVWWNDLNGSTRRSTRSTST